VLNKHARHNLCFDLHAQEPQYEKGKGTIVPYSVVELLGFIRTSLPSFLGNEKARDLKCEGNYYYDPSKCGVGFHGDEERKRVVGLRLGHSLPLHYQWFNRCRPIGERVKTLLHHGDIYIMSEKASGYDWRKNSLITLRHAAGCKKYLTIAGQDVSKWAEKGSSGSKKAST